METATENKELPQYLREMRDDFIVQAEKKGVSLQDIADIFSYGISKARVHQILNSAKR